MNHKLSPCFTINFKPRKYLGVESSTDKISKYFAILVYRVHPENELDMFYFVVTNLETGRKKVPSSWTSLGSCV